MEGLWVNFLEAVALALCTAITLGITKLINYLIAKTNANEVEKQAYQALLEGMAKAQNDLVRAAKDAAEDGKLTKEEIQKAEQIALEHAKNIASGEVKDLILTWSKEKASSLIKQFLSGLGKSKK